MARINGLVLLGKSSPETIAIFPSSDHGGFEDHDDHGGILFQFSSTIWLFNIAMENPPIFNR